MAYVCSEPGEFMAVQQEVVQLPSTLGPPGRGRGVGNHLSATSDHALFTQLPRKQTHTPQATGQPRPPETNGRPGFSNLLRILPQGRPLQVSPLLPECRNSLVTLHGQPGVVGGCGCFLCPEALLLHKLPPLETESSFWEELSQLLPEGTGPEPRSQ